jgi:hypothetical protein
MLSLTFCSWPESVCRTNHWLRIEASLLRDLQQLTGSDTPISPVHAHGEYRHQAVANEHHHGRPFNSVIVGQVHFFSSSRVSNV